MTSRKQDQAGFTMAELLIVVAIVAVLVAIAIPVFTSQLEAAKAGTCLSNRTSAAHALTVAYITDGENINEAVVLQEAMGVTATGSTAGGGLVVEGGEGICPSGGDITFKRSAEGVYTATCSLHGEDGEETPGGEGYTGFTSGTITSSDMSQLLRFAIGRGGLANEHHEIVLDSDADLEALKKAFGLDSLFATDTSFKVKALANSADEPATAVLLQVKEGKKVWYLSDGNETYKLDNKAEQALSAALKDDKVDIASIIENQKSSWTVVE